MRHSEVSGLLEVGRWTMSQAAERASRPAGRGPNSARAQLWHRTQLLTALSPVRQVLPSMVALPPLGLPFMHGARRGSPSVSRSRQSPLYQSTGNSRADIGHLIRRRASTRLTRSHEPGGHMSERKYRQRGYQDEPREPRREQPPAAKKEYAPRGQPPIAPKTFNMPGFREAVRCTRCGNELTVATAWSPEATCTRCGADLHTCAQCVNFDTSAAFECQRPMPVRVSPKDARTRARCSSRARRSSARPSRRRRRARARRSTICSSSQRRRRRRLAPRGPACRQVAVP